MARFPDWPEKLVSYINSEQDKPFRWGKNDCALFTCGGIFAITGTDYAKEFRGKYKTEKGSYRILKRIENVSTLEELANRYLGDSIAVSHARRGDIVLHDFPAGKALGICLGIFSAFRSPNGIEMHKTLSCEKAWRID